jgi:hypothetical protein
VTLTQRHDPAMVIPVAGNTYETHAGQPRPAADRDPLATVHGTARPRDRRPADGRRRPRATPTRPRRRRRRRRRAPRCSSATVTSVAIDEPVHTIRAGGQHHGLVMANRANNVPRDAEVDPTHPVLTGEHLAVVMRNNNSRGNSGAMCSPTHEPMRALTTKGHQSIVIPYASGNEPAAADRAPTPTLTTRDRLALVVPAGGTWAREATPAGEPMPTQTATESRGLAWTDEDIDACRFRMFALHEIAGAMVMADHVDGSGYVVVGNKRERMAQYGNAVTPPRRRRRAGRRLRVDPTRSTRS